MKNNVTRKDFLVKTSRAAVGITAVAGLSSLITTASKGNSKVTPWPWPYTQLDKEAVRIQAHYLYYNSMACCAGTFGGIVSALATAVGDPWTNLPMEIMLYGGGGGKGWGTLCGCLNGGAALISLVTNGTQSTALISELWGWYTQADLPTTEANQVGIDGHYLVHNYDQDLLQNVSGSPLCHASVTEWCITAGKTVSSTERKERCARITGDVAAKTVEILNAFFAGTFTSTYVDPATLTACMGCHGSTVLNNVMTKMNCTPCHGDPHGASTVKDIGGSAISFKLCQNYPNPFNPSTKIQFSLPQVEKVRLEIYDIQGNFIRSLVDHELYQSGNFEVEWDGRNNHGERVSSGIYFAKMQAGKFSQTKKMNLIK
jgi:hypothetical protein